MSKSVTTGRTLYWFFSFVVVLLAIRWVPMGVEKGIPEVAYHLQDRGWLLYIHMVASAVPMAFIPFQLWTKFRMKRPKLHRIMGRMSVVGVYLGGLTLIPLALNIPVPAWGQAGFVAAGVLWIAAVSMGLYYIYTKNQRLHRWWMMITATVIFGAVTQRLMLPIYIVMGYPHDIAYSLTPWSAFSINLALFFLWQYRRKIRAAFTPVDKTGTT